jgi:uncharacterized integral membrane protein (TIGR00697 family)
MMNDEKTIYSKYEFLSNLKIFFYLALFVNNVMIYKLVDIVNIHISAASIVFPLTYLIITIITEGYDYKEARKLVYQSVYINIIFGLLISLLIKLPSPETFDKQSDFLAIFPDIFLHCVVHGLAAIVSYELNIYLLRKLKFFYIGRSFILRSVIATIIGEFSLTLIMVMYSWHGYKSASELLTMLFSTYSSKLIWAIFGAYPALFIIKMIQNKYNNREEIVTQMINDSENKIRQFK